MAGYTFSKTRPISAELRYSTKQFGRGSFGATHIFEAVAKKIERPRGEDIRQLVSSPGSYRYLGLWLELIKAGPFMKDDDTLSHQFHCTLLAIADLSLFTPLGTAYARLRFEMDSWYEISPAHRFFALLQHVQKVKLPTDLTEIELFQEHMSELLHWRRPREFIELGAALKATNRFEARHRDACRLRLDNWTCFLQDIPPEAFATAYLPSITGPRWQGIMTFGSADHQKGCAVDYLFWKITSAIMRSERLNLEKEVWTLLRGQSSKQIRDIFFEGVPALRDSNYITM